MTTATTDTKNRLAETALYYARCGWHVHPLKPREKTPLTTDGVHDATTDPDTIRQWWGHWPDANIALNCGASGLLVLDFDTDKPDFAGGELLENLRNNYPTTTAQTGSGGSHLLYLQPDGETLGNSRGKLPTGVDVRGGGGYIVVAPSIHPNGNEYRWTTYPAQPTPHTNGHSNGHYTGNAPTAAELVDMAIRRAGADGRNNAGLWLACQLRDSGHGEAEAAGYMTDYQRAVEHAKPEPYTEGEARGTLRSAYNKPARSAWTPTNPPPWLTPLVSGNGNGYTPPAWMGQDDIPTDEEAESQTGPDESTDGEAVGLADLLEELAGLEGSREALETFALNNVELLATLGKAGASVFCSKLRARGATADWIRNDLKPAIKEAQSASAPTTAAGGGGFSATWTDYVRTAQALGYTFRLNDLADTIEVNGERMTDVHEAVLLSKLHAIGLRSADVARRAFTTAAAGNRYHPVKEYLEGLKWDGIDHIGNLAGYFSDTHDPITYADGARRTVIHAFLRRWLVGAVGKVYDPKRNQNPMLILDGGQGKGKSYFAKWICPLEGLHFEGAIRPEDKDYSGYVTTRLVWEVSELGATMRRADREALKEFITKQDATFRPAYGRHALVKPTLASFIGTVNFEGALLSDPTGNRRFWPVTLTGLNWNYSRDIDVNQVWAHAYALYRMGETGQLCPEERAVHGEIVQTYEAEDILAGFVLDHFRVEPDNTTFWTPTTEIISILRSPTGADLKGSERALSMQLSSTLTSLGLVRTRRRDGAGNPRWGYVGIARKP